MTKFIHRYYCVVDAVSADAFRELYRELTGDDGWETVCRTPLAGSADPKAEPTHFACSFVATEEVAAGIDALQGENKLPPGVKIIRVDAVGPDTGKIKGATHADHKAKIGQRWDTRAELAEMGLAFKESEIGAKPVDPKEAEARPK